MSDNEMKIYEAMKKIDEAISELKTLFNDENSSLYIMAKISDNARILNNTDFLKTITD